MSKKCLHNCQKISDLPPPHFVAQNMLILFGIFNINAYICKEFWAQNLIRILWVSDYVI